MSDRLSSLDDGYESGDLSLFPEALDDKDNLYEAKNNAEIKLKQSLSYNGKHIIVDSTKAFPRTGLLRIGPKGEAGNFELIYYGKKTDTIFTQLIRGFAGSRQNSWNADNIYVSSGVMAEHHNAVKDAILNIQKTLGTKNSPEDGTLNKSLKDLEAKFLAPKPAFRSFPQKGTPPLTVTFQNFTEGDAIRFLWDFGDGTTSIEKNPVHTYQNEGIYTIKLNIITSTGAQGVGVKKNYITVSEDEVIPFFYVVPSDPNNPNYSTQTAQEDGGTAQTFKFVDQTDGDIVQRYWVFGDGTTEAVTDHDVHTTTHVYETPGNYEPSLLIIFDNQRLKRVFLSDQIEVI